MTKTEIKTVYEEMKLATENKDSKTATSICTDLLNNENVMTQYYIIKAFKCTDTNFFYEFTELTNKAIYHNIISNLYAGASKEDHKAVYEIGLGNLDMYKTICKEVIC